MTTLKSTAARSILAALVATMTLSMAAPTADAAKRKQRYEKYYVVFVKHHANKTIGQTYWYRSKKAAEKKNAAINNEYWIKVTPVVGKPFYRDSGKDYVGVQIASIPDKVFEGITGVSLARVELIKKQAVVRVRWWDHHKNKVYTGK